MFLPGAPLSIKQKLGSSSPPVAAVKPSMLYVMPILQALEALWKCIVNENLYNIYIYFLRPAIVSGSGKFIVFRSFHGLEWTYYN